MTAIIHADVELWLTGWLRTELDARPEPVCQGVKVDNKVPTGTLPAKLVVIRYDGSSVEELNVDSAAVGVTVYAGTKALPQDANDLARIIRALIGDSARVEAGNPVAAVTGANGPIPVADDGEKAVRYLTFELRVVGAPL